MTGRIKQIIINIIKRLEEFYTDKIIEIKSDRICLKYIRGIKVKINNKQNNQNTNNKQTNKHKL